MQLPLRFDNNFPLFSKDYGSYTCTLVQPNNKHQEELGTVADPIIRGLAPTVIINKHQDEVPLNCPSAHSQQKLSLMVYYDICRISFASL